MIEALFHDGKSSQQRNVLIYADPPGHLRVIGDGVDIGYTLAEVRPSARIGNTRRHLRFADGSHCETEDNDAIDRIFSDVRATKFDGLLHRWESRIGYVIFALVLAAGALWAGLTYGIPALAKQVAFSLSPATDRMLGQEALAGLDKVFLRPSQLPPERQAGLRALFAEITTSVPGAADYRLELRTSKAIGANALALPAGIVVVTDPLVELAKNDHELTAVLAHEIGHLAQRHALRSVLHNSASALVIVAVTGDLGSLVSVTAAFPTLLVNLKYSRDFEREADDFAYDYLKRRGIPTESLNAILLRLEKKTGASRDVPDYLSSHPPVRERAERSRVTR